MLYEVGYPSRPKDAVKMYCDQYGIKAKGIRRLGKGTPATYEVILGE